MFVPSSQKHNEYITFLSLSLPLMHNKYAKESDFVRVFRLIKCPLILMEKTLGSYKYIFFKYSQAFLICVAYFFQKPERVERNVFILPYSYCYLNTFQQKFPLSYVSCSRKR